MNMALHFLKFIQVFSDFGKKAFYLLESPPPLSTIKDIEDYFHVFDRSWFGLLASILLLLTWMGDESSVLLPSSFLSLKINYF